MTHKQYINLAVGGPPKIIYLMVESICRLSRVLENLLLFLSSAADVFSATCPAIPTLATMTHISKPPLSEPAFNSSDPLTCLRHLFRPMWDPRPHQSPSIGSYPYQHVEPLPELSFSGL